MDVLAKFLLYKIYLVVRYIFILVQSLVWRINGTTSTLDQIWNGDMFESSAQVLDIVWRFKPGSRTVHGPENFLTTHRTFADPNIIRSEAVSLMCVLKNEAFFVEVPPDVDLYHCAKYPLMFMHQYDFAIRVIRMPISSFHRIAQTIGDPDDKEVIIVHQTGRCGGTLLVQLFERLRLGDKPGRPCISLSECTNFQPVFSDDEHEFLAVVRSVFRVMCKYETPLVIIKAGFKTWIRMAPDISHLFPRFHQLFADRSSLPQMISKWRVTENAIHFRLLHFVQRNPVAARWLSLAREDWLRQYYCELYEQLKQGDTLVNLTMFETLCLYTLSLKKRYADEYERGTRIAAVRLEDIKHNSHSALRQVLTYCKLEEGVDQIPEMLKAFEQDSHWNNPDEMCRMNRGDQSESVTAADVVRCDALCDRFGLPRLSDSTNLPGTISPLPSPY